MIKGREDEIATLLERLFPINRSLTGDGNRETLRILQELIPLKILEYPAGKSVFDWTIPDEWHIRNAWVKDLSGRKIVDFSNTPLHVVAYSEAVHLELTAEELLPRLHVLERMPDAIPYRTSYYERSWGFCVSKEQYETIRNSTDRLEVMIDAQFDPNGSMSLGEVYIPGERPEEYLVSTYICHPFMANDNLSGVVCAALWAREMLKIDPPKFSWRFVFAPETIGAIAYLFYNQNSLPLIQGAFVLSCCGGPGPLGYKASFLGNSSVDRAMEAAFREKSIDPIRYPFTPFGSDERQFSSPGFRIPTVSVTKNKYHEYDEYHTSKDNLDFVNGPQIEESLDVYLEIAKILETNETLRSLNPWGEPQLGRRKLYSNRGGAFLQPGAAGTEDAKGETKFADVEAMIWLLFFADGDHDLVTISEKSNITFSRLLTASKVLLESDLLENSENKTAELGLPV